VRDDLGNGEDHVRGRRVLHRHAVQHAADAECLWIGHVCRGNVLRPDWAERVRRLPTRPLAVRELEVARADVVEADVAAHRLERVLFGDSAYALTDHDAELGLIVHLFRDARYDDRLTGPD